MKTPSDNLYRLVHAMTAAEKRYFKRHYSSGKNMLTELFNYLNSLPEYDEELVKQHFTGSKLVKNLKVYKVQLSELLLKSLTSYNHKNSVRSRIRIGLEETHILLDKQLYQMARGKIKKLKRLCQEHEEFDYLMSVLKLEGQFNTFYNIAPGANIERLFQEMEQAKDCINTQFFLQKTSSQLVKTINSGKGVECFENFAKILQQVESLKPKGFTEAHFRFQTLGSLYALNGDIQQELYYKKEGILLFEQNKNQIPNKISLYFCAIHNYLSSCNVHRQFDDFDEQFEKIKLLPEQYPKLDRNFIFILYLKVRSLFQQHKFGEIDTKLETNIVAAALRYDMESPLILSSTYLHLAVAYLYRNDFQKALYYLREHNSNNSKNPMVIQLLGLVVEMICHFEANDKFTLENLISSLKRRIKKKKFYTPFFNELLSLFPKVMKLALPERQARFVTLYNQRTQYNKDSCYVAFKSLKLELWLLSKVKHTSLDTIIDEGKMSDIEIA